MTFFVLLYFNKKVHLCKKNKMKTVAPYKPLTPSGKGISFENRPLEDFSKEEITELLNKYHWIAFKKNEISLGDLTNYLEQFGSVVKNDRRDGAVLKVDGGKKEEVFLGNGFLPLHKDGLLMGNNVGMVSIFCMEYNEVSDGRTFITDIENAINEVPNEIQDLLRAKGMDVKPLDAYYLTSSDKWYHMSGFLEVDGKEYLNIGFPYKRGEKSSWLTQIEGLNEDEFYEVFDVLDKAVMDPKYCYFHDWEKGDILLFDNRKTLHGREAFKGQRALANIQVVFEK